MIFVIVENRIAQKNTAIATEEVKPADQSVIVLIATTVRVIQMEIKIQILNQKRKQNFKSDYLYFSIQLKSKLVTERHSVEENKKVVSM